MFNLVYLHYVLWKQYFFGVYVCKWVSAYTVVHKDNKIVSFTDSRSDEKKKKETQKLSTCQFRYYCFFLTFLMLSTVVDNKFLLGNYACP